MPSHQARRKPLPKDYQFPTPQRRCNSLPMLWPIVTDAEKLRAYVQGPVCIERGRAWADDDEGYGHAV